jgi:hypothetical protein
MTQRSSALCAFLSLLTPLMPAQAETFCVQDSAGLHSALQKAEDNGEDDLIKIGPGIYSPATASGYSADIRDSHGLAVGGGFDTSSAGVPCGIQLHGAQWTTIDGKGNKLLLHIKMTGGSAPFTMYGITFVNGFSSDARPILAVNGYNGWSGNVGIENFVAREHHAKAIVMQFATMGGVFFRSSAITRNYLVDNGTIIDLRVSSAPAAPAGIYFNNNTIAGNVMSPTDATSSIVRFVGSSSSDIRISNSIIFNESGNDLLSVGSNIYMDHSDIGPRNILSGTVVESNAYMDAPEFAGPADYRLGVSSTLRNGGENSPIGGIGSFDVEGDARILFGAVDVGAYEWRDGIFQNEFESP